MFNENPEKKFIVETKGIENKICTSPNTALFTHLSFCDSEFNFIKF